jgi:hypothetical protein
VYSYLPAACSICFLLLVCLTSCLFFQCGPSVPGVACYPLFPVLLLLFQLVLFCCFCLAPPVLCLFWLQLSLAWSALFLLYVAHDLLDTDIDCTWEATAHPTPTYQHRLFGVALLVSYQHRLFGVALLVA